MTDGDYPQPHEGITGTAREDDDLLSLDELAFPRRMLMRGMTFAMRDACLVGNPAPVVRDMWERMKDPQPGDLVVETSTAWSKDEGTITKGFGILLAHRKEWWQTDAEWAAEIEEERVAYEKFLQGPYSHPGDGPFDPSQHERTTDHAWYIQYGPAPGDICRWTNCDFMTVITDTRPFHYPAGRRDGNATVFTRDSLTASLAHSGFTLKPAAQAPEDSE